MIKLAIFSNMAKQLVKIRGFVNKSTTIFEKLPIIIFMKDFY